MIILLILFLFISGKIDDMNNNNNVVYNSIEMKNEFGKFVEQNEKNEKDIEKEITADEIYLKDYNFFPSLELTFKEFLQSDDLLEI